MLRITGTKQRLCDGMSRRTALKIGALGMGGLSLPGLLRAERAARKYSFALLRQIERQRSCRWRRSGRCAARKTSSAISSVRSAFDLASEPAELRRKYGPSLFGNSMLVARRLVEAGVPFISVHAENFLPNGSFTYDMHENNFAMLKEHNLPVLDTLLPALVEDLDQRGLLDSTLIYVMGEMGRSPKINAKAGRDHWPQCGFCLMFGGGIAPGVVYGESDAIAAYPKSDPVSPADIVATIYQQLGIDVHATIPDRAGRPMPIAHGGQPIVGLT